MSFTFQNLPDLLAAIRAKPGMYIGAPSVNNLHCFLDGFEMAENQYAIPQNTRLSGFDFIAFEEWIAAKYNPERLSARSFTLARLALDLMKVGFRYGFDGTMSFGELLRIFESTLFGSHFVPWCFHG